MAVIGEMVYNTDMTIEETIAEIKRKALRDKVPIMEDEGLDFLCDFLKKHRINSLLEVGTAVGYSSIMMAHHNPQLKILTLEQDEERYHEAVEKYGKGSFKAGMGAEALKTLLEEVDLDKLSSSLRKELEQKSIDTKLIKQIEDIIDECSIALYSQSTIDKNLNLEDFYNKTFDVMKKLNI